MSEALINDIANLTEQCLLKDKEIERLNNIIKEIEKMFDRETLNKYYYGMSYEFEIADFKDDILDILKGANKK